jgi:putative ABC transport system permease protein
MSRVFDYGEVRGDLTGAGAVLSAGQARRYGLAIGDTFRQKTVLRTLNGRPQFSDAVEYRVVAIADRLPVRENQFAVTRSLFPGDRDTRIYFNYAVTRKEQVMEAAQALLQTPAYGEARLRDRSAELTELRQQVAQRLVILGAVALIILLMAAFGLFNALVTGLHQRRREMATVRAVGATPAQLTRQVIWEALLIGWTGTLLGLVAGAFFVEAVSVALGDGGISLQYGLGAALTCLIAGPLLGAAAGILPALRMSRASVTRLLHAE